MKSLQSKNFDKNYVRVFWGNLEPPTSILKTFLLHKVKKYCHFRNPQPLCSNTKYIYAPLFNNKNRQNYLLNRHQREN